jgi:hypothetical protein
MATLTDAQKIEKYRAQANDKTIPQDVRNDLLDKANALEYKAYGESKKMAKGGDVKKAPAKKPAVKPMSKGKPTGVAILITPAKKMNKGGAVKAPMAKKGKC